MARKEKKYHFIYKTTNVLSGKYYLGMHSTDNLNDGYMGSGKRLRYSINKHGKDNHKVEILEFVDTREELKKREEEIVNLNEIAKVECMNLKVGGEGGFISEEQQRHRSSCAGKARAERLKSDLDYAKEWSELSSSIMKQNHKDGKMRYDTFKGKTHSEETKEKMRKSKNKGSANPQFGTCWVTNSEEVKKIKKEDLETYLNNGWRRGRK